MLAIIEFDWVLAQTLSCFDGVLLYLHGSIQASVLRSAVGKVVHWREIRVPSLVVAGVFVIPWGEGVGWWSLAVTRCE